MNVLLDKSQVKTWLLLFFQNTLDMAATNSGVKSILKLYLVKSSITDGKTTRSKVESID